MNLWLDDIRNPVHFGRLGYKWVKTVKEAQEALETGEVIHCSLDHDLGACDVCMDKHGDVDAWLERSKGMAMPNCEHFGTGYDLVCWMVETDNWPAIKPEVHSMNPEGKARMKRVIDMAWAKRSE